MSCYYLLSLLFSSGLSLLCWLFVCGFVCVGEGAWCGLVDLQVQNIAAQRMAFPAPSFQRKGFFMNHHPKQHLGE